MSRAKHSYTLSITHHIHYIKLIDNKKVRRSLSFYGTTDHSYYISFFQINGLLPHKVLSYHKVNAQRCCLHIQSWINAFLKNYDKYRSQGPPLYLC